MSDLHLEIARKRRAAHREAPIDRWLDALAPDYRPIGGDPDAWRARCPAHNDTRPSLILRRNADGTIWFKCWADCPKEIILRQLGLEWRDCWADSDRDAGRWDAPFARDRVLPVHLRRTMERMLTLDEAA